MGRNDSASANQSHWERWTGETGPFYRACAVVPFDPISDAHVEPSDCERPAVEFATGVTRLMLRNLPTVLLLVLVLYVPTLLLNFVVSGRLQISFPELTLTTGVVAIPAVVIGGLWVYLLYTIVASPFRGRSIHRSVVFYATAIPLVIGTGHAAYTAWIATSAEAQPAVTVQAGYFLFVLVAGHLVYDGLALKTEHLLAQLRTTGIVKQPAYDDFYAELTSVLGDTLTVGPVSLPRSVGFALALALIPILLPVIGFQWSVWGVLAYIPYSVVTLFVIAVFYDVFILVYEFTDLLQRDLLVYRPFHPDDHGGFRDLGRFATRVNAILVVAGGYVAYRFYAEGILNIPAAGFSSSFVALTWAVLYLGPIAAYVFLAIFWLYHSFWRLHRKMEEGRQRRIEELQRMARIEQDDPSQEFTDLDADAPAWESLQSAPTWPIKRQSLFGIVVIDAVPVVATFLL